MTLHIDLINTGSLRETADGFDIVTEYLTTDVTGNPDSVRYNALQNSQIPRIGDSHFSVPFARVVEREVLPVSGSPQKWLIRVRYETPAATDDEDDDPNDEFGPVNWSGSTRSEETEIYRDINGEPMLLSYRGAPTFERINQYSGEVEPRPAGYYVRHVQVHSVVVDRPLATITGTRREASNPEQRSIKYHGTINRETWRGFAPRTMLLREISFNARDGEGWEVSYTFQHNPETWLHKPVFTMPTSIGPQTPHDAGPGNGFEEYEIYRSVSFSALGLE